MNVIPTFLELGRNPIRIIIDKKGNIPKSATVFDDQAQTIVLTSEHIDFKKNIAQQLCTKLHDMNLLSVLVEGGQKTLQHFIDENLWDEIRIFKGDVTFEEGLKGPVFEAKPKFKTKIVKDELLIYTNEKKSII